MRRANPVGKTSASVRPHAIRSRRERHGSELRERLFRAALALFAKKGYLETTVEDITEAIDVGKGTFFNYFPSKDHILRGLVHRMTEAPIQNPAVVRALLQAHLSSPVVREEMFRLHRAHQKLIGGMLRHGQQRGEIRRDLD